MLVAGSFGRGNVTSSDGRFLDMLTKLSAREPPYEYMLQSRVLPIIFNAAHSGGTTSAPEVSRA
eukprot:6483824-Amphidinium_carterae.1